VELDIKHRISLNNLMLIAEMYPINETIIPSITEKDYMDK